MCSNLLPRGQVNYLLHCVDLLVRAKRAELRYKARQQLRAAEGADSSAVPQGSAQQGDSAAGKEPARAEGAGGGGQGKKTQ
jgi:hypothetical protein